MVPRVGTLRASAVWGLPDVLVTLGVEIDIVLDDARLPRDVFSSRDNVFTYPSNGTFVTRLRAEIAPAIT